VAALALSETERLLTSLISVPFSSFSFLLFSFRFSFFFGLAVEQ